MTARKGKVGITDTTLRDAHQSLLATRMRTEHMLPIAEKMDKMGFHSLEVWGGATFDTCMRFLGEDPWERLRALRKAFKNTKLQMLLRGQNLVGYKHYADDVVEAFVEKAAENGIDIFRIFDALNDTRNMEKAMQEVKKNNKHVQAAISYTIGPIYDLKYYVDLAKKLKNLGADSICIKDMAGILTPYFAYDLVKELKKETKLPIQMHTHYTSGMGAMMYLKAIEAGADVVDTANSAMAMGTSQPATETMIATLNDAGYDTGMNLDSVSEATEYFKETRKKYTLFDVYKGGVDVNVLRYQVPGGMLSNFISQLSQQNALDKLEDVLLEVPRVRADMGFPPLVTPSSQIVGSQAVFNVLMGERYKMVTNEVKNYMKGLYGQPPGKVNEEIRKQIIGDFEPITGRPADLLEPQLETAKQEIGELAKTTEDLLLYIMFPQVGKPFLEGTLEPEKLEEEIVCEKKSTKEQEKSEQRVLSGTTAVSSFARKRRNSKASNLSFYFNGTISNLDIKVDGNSYQVAVDGERGDAPPVKADEKPENIQSKPSEKKAPTKTEEYSSETEKIVAPLPGKIWKIEVQPGDKVSEGDTIIILEAMKMENPLTTSISGTVAEIMFKEGDSVNPGDVLAVIK